MTSTATAFATPPCDAPEYRQFDFWIGDWQVFKPDGTVAGTNRIEQEYGGCVLHEHYQTAKGYTGESLNTYDPGRKLWRQTWVDNTGTLLLLDGNPQGSAMVMNGSTTDATGAVTRHRITWTPNHGPLCQYRLHVRGRRRSFQSRTRKVRDRSHGKLVSDRAATGAKSRRACEQHHPDDDLLNGPVLRGDFYAAHLGAAEL